MNVTKTEQLQIRVSPAEKAAIKRAAKRSGMSVSAWVLAQALPIPTLEFQRIMGRLSGGSEPSFALADLNDLLASWSRQELERAVAEPPARQLPDVLANQVAAMIELTAHKKGAKAPLWTAEIKPLDNPYFATRLKSLRLHLLVNAPLPFRRRNLFVDASVGDRV